MLEARDYVDQEIWWEPKNGHTNIWHGNCTQIGALRFFLPCRVRCTYSGECETVICRRKMEFKFIRIVIYKEVCDHVQHNLMVEEGFEEWDRLWWMANPSGKYTVKLEKL